MSKFVPTPPPDDATLEQLDSEHDGVHDFRGPFSTIKLATELLAKRASRQADFDAGKLPDFLPETKSVREAEWKVADQPKDILDRRVEITGPTERKMMINALNSGAKVFMADFEDALSPTWENVIAGQINCSDSIRRTISSGPRRLRNLRIIWESRSSPIAGARGSSSIRSSMRKLIVVPRMSDIRNR